MYSLLSWFIKMEILQLMLDTYPVHNETIRESMTSNIEVLHVVYCTGKKMIKRNIS